MVAVGLWVLALALDTLRVLGRRAQVRRATRVGDGSAVASAFVQDGTYRIAKVDHADAILEGNLRSIKYSSIRGTRLDTMLPEELRNTVVIEWTLRDSRNPVKILASGSSSGSSQLFAGANLQTARNNALPEALERAGEALVSRLANGY